MPRGAAERYDDREGLASGPELRPPAPQYWGSLNSVSASSSPSIGRRGAPAGAATVSLEECKMTTETERKDAAEGPSVDEIMERLQTVEDPEIRLSIVDLGLVYGAEYVPEEQRIDVTMTLTSPGCPLGGLIQGQAYHVLKDLPAVKDVDVKITFSPPWDPRTMASEDVKMMLGIW